jgi:hypothetical protein
VARRWGALLGVALLLGTLVPATVATAQGTSGQAQGEGDGVGQGGALISLVAQTQWVPPNGEMVLRFATSNIPGTATISVRVHPMVRSRTQFDDAADGRNLGTALTGGPAAFERAAAPLAGDGASVQLAIPVARTGPAPAGGVVLNFPGVYPVSITATEGGRELAELVTYLVRIPTTDTPGDSLRVGVVVPLDGHLELDEGQPTPDVGQGSDDQGDDGEPAGLELASTEPARSTVATVNGYPTLPLTIDAVPAAVEAWADSDPSAAAALRTLGAAASHQVLANPYVRVDTGAWVANGLIPQLDRQMTAGATVLTEVLGGAGPAGRTAVLDPTTTPAALAYLHGLGVDRAVVPSDQLDEPTDSGTFLQLFELDDGAGGTVQGAVADVDLAARLVDTGDPVLDAQRTLAELAVLYREQEQVERGLALVVPPETAPQTLSLLFTALARPAVGDGRAVVEPVTLDTLFDETSVATTSGPRRPVMKLDYEAPAPGSLGAYPSQLRAAERQVDGFRSLAAPSPEQVVPFDQAVLASGAIELDTSGRSAILDWTTDSIDEAAAAVVALPQDYVTLTSQSGQIPLNLENRLPYPVRVQVVARSAKLDFPQGNVQDLELPAAEPYPHEIAVTTRASGAFPIDVTVQSPDGTLQLASSRFTVRSTAISGVGLVLSIGAGAFLLLWWGRHFRKTRRARRLVANDHPALVGAAFGTDAADLAPTERPDDTAGPQDHPLIPPADDASTDEPDDPRGYARPEPTEPGGSRWP